jgi:hypothetical protein
MRLKESGDAGGEQRGSGVRDTQKLRLDVGGRANGDTNGSESAR